MEGKMTIAIRGSGDVGSAAAQLLFSRGYTVFIHDSALPSATRRKMSFTDAIFDGTAELEGVTSQRADNLSDLKNLLAVRRVLPITTLDLTRLLAAIRPLVLVDARMKKHQQPEVQIHLANFTIGLGPNFTAGETVHVAIETNRGENLGRLISQGAAESLQGEPNEINGHARDRYIYAPQAGLFHTSAQIGQRVLTGQEIARIDDTPIYSPMDGKLRGLTHDGVPVQIKTKVVEIDPRDQDAQITGIAERPRRIAQGVLAAVQEWETASMPKS